MYNVLCIMYLNICNYKNVITNLIQISCTPKIFIIYSLYLYSLTWAQFGCPLGLPQGRRWVYGPPKAIIIYNTQFFV